MDIADGPHLAVAVFCKAVLNENGLASVQKIIDHIRIPTRKPGQPTPISRVQAFVQFRAGAVTSKHRVSFQVTGPDGKDVPGDYGTEFQLQEPYQHEHLPWAFELPWEVGRYFFDLYLDDQFLTRMTLDVLAAFPPLQPMQAGPRRPN